MPTKSAADLKREKEEAAKKAKEDKDKEEAELKAREAKAKKDKEDKEKKDKDRCRDNGVRRSPPSWMQTCKPGRDQLIPAYGHRKTGDSGKQVAGRCERTHLPTACSLAAP